MKGILVSFSDYMAHINLTKEEIGFSITPRQRDTTGPRQTKVVLT